MNDSTLAALQSLKDAEFHALCDEILPRISPRYHPLVPHGRNETGDSIVGQPDSYIGGSAEKCRIAIQYTVQRKSWWSKAVEDVVAARDACPKAEEIVIVLPRDVDREKPKKGKRSDWQHDAEKAAEPAKLTVIHGRTLVQQLDTSCQDLRFHFLGIPVSRISWHALMAGCRDSNGNTLGRLKLLGRYDPIRYVEREADERFFRLWQQSLRIGPERRTLIPLIADSGIGKTSLLAHFAENSSPQAPVLLLQARDLSFNQNDSLIRQVMDRLQCSINADTQSSEEAHLAMMLTGKTPLTVVLDGLDETSNVSGVRKAIDTWIWSKLGRTSVLVVSSRPEFWRNCRDATWSNLILRDDDHPKAARSLRHETNLATLDPMQGIELPGQFAPHDLSRAWIQSGQPEAEFWRLPEGVRQELRHPFTMRSALDLLATGTPSNLLRTRSAILNLWIQNRLKAEVDDAERISERQYRECLMTVARLADAEESTWVAVENLDGLVPRFDLVKPPGRAVERLIAANILETHPKHPDQIRFSFEAVHDFFLAESQIGAIEKNPDTAAKDFAGLSFSKAVTRLERIGDQIASQPFREKFVQSLAELDGLKAAAVIRPRIESYSSECRACVVSKVAQLLTSRMDAERALATELLGRLKCSESSTALESHWTVNTVSKRVHPLVSRAAISHSIVSLVPHVFRTRWFTHDNFFVDLRPELLASTEEFRNSLAMYASQFIPSDEHSDDYRRALMVLTYLKDERAIKTIEKRTVDAIPFFYESLCLLGNGSPLAMEVYSSLIDRYIEAKQAGIENKEDKDWWMDILPHANIGVLATNELEEFVLFQLESLDTERQLIGRFLAERIGTERLLTQMTKRWQVKGYYLGRLHGFGRRLGGEKWIALWNQARTLRDWNALIEIARDLRDVRVESLLIEQLGNSELGGYCAQSLAAMGSQRACPAIRQLLVTERDGGDGKDLNRYMAFRALAHLRDPASVPDIVHYIESEKGANDCEGTVGLASIGTEEAERALLELKNQSDEVLVRGLVHFGSRVCIERAVEIAKQHDSENGASWLVEHCRFSFQMFHGWSSNHYRTDVDLEPLLTLMLAEKLTEEDYDHLRSMLDDIDSPVVRRLLREWYDLRGTPDDVKLKSPENTKLSDWAFRELAARGDAHVLTAFIEKEVEQLADYEIHSQIIEELAVFDRGKVQSTLRTMLKNDHSVKELRVVLDLIGYVGDKSDVGKLNQLIESESDRVANAAFEAKLRLTDPLRLAEYW